MEGNIVNKFFTTLKNKINTSNKDNPQGLDFAFSFEEINNLTKQNNEKIKELKKNPLIKEEKKEKITQKEDNKSPTKNIEKPEENQIIDINPETVTIENQIIDQEKEDKTIESYINLTKEKENIIAESWQKIDITKLDEHILKGKDILAHNYTITYGDDSLAYIYMIRGEYDILIEYFIGFNNEKKGIHNKTIFADKIDNEWRYLANYIKILEKIRGVKK